MDMVDTSVAVRKIRLQDSNDGYDPSPLSFKDSWNVCINIEAITGPIELPMSTITTEMPTDTPLYLWGVYCNTILNAPTFINDSPADIITKLIEIMDSVE